MSEWQETTLGEEVNLITGFPFKSSQYTDNENDIPLIRGDNIVQGRLRWDGVKRWPVDDITIDESYKLREGDVVLAMDRPWIEAGLKFAVISRFDPPCYLVQRVACLRGKKDICSVFLRYLIASKDFTQHILSVETGSAVPHISGSQIKEFIFQRPPLEEQKSIASVLSSLDDKIDLLHRQNKTLEAMAETLFRQWFVEGVGEDWRDRTLGEFFPVVTGKKDANFSTEDGLYPFFTCSQAAIKAPNYSFDAAAILLSGNGDFNVKRYVGKFEAYQRTYVLIPNDVSYFNFLFTLIKYYLSDITGGHQGSVINFITKGMITDFAFRFPESSDAIKDKLAYFDRIYEKVDSNFRQISSLEKLRDNLLPKLMSGEVRVA